MTTSHPLKTKLETIRNRVTAAEKVAEKQIRSALKSTEKFRSDQLKTVQGLLKKARSSKQSQHLISQAEKVRHEIEERATAGLDLVMAKLNLPSRKEVERLTKRISSLQKRLEEVETTTHSRASSTTKKK